MYSLTFQARLVHPVFLNIPFVQTVGTLVSWLNGLSVLPICTQRKSAQQQVKVSS